MSLGSSSSSVERPSSSSTAVYPRSAASPAAAKAQRGGPRSRIHRRRHSEVATDNYIEDEQESTARRVLEAKSHARTTSVDIWTAPYTSAVANRTTLPSPVIVVDDPEGGTVTHRLDEYQSSQRQMPNEMDPLFCDTARSHSAAALSIDLMPPLSSPWSESSAPSEGIITPQDPAFSPLSGPLPGLPVFPDGSKHPAAHAAEYELSPGSRPAALAAVLDLDEDDVPPLNPTAATHATSGVVSVGDGEPTTMMRSMRFDVSPVFADFGSSSFSSSSALDILPVDASASFSTTGASTYRRPTDDYSALALAAGNMNGSTNGAVYSLDSPLSSPLLPPSEESAGLASLLRRDSYKFNKMRLPSMLSIVTAVATTPRHPRAFIIDTPPSTPKPLPEHYASVSPKRARSPILHDAHAKADTDYFSARTKRIIGLGVKVGFWISVVIFLSAMFGFGAPPASMNIADDLRAEQHAAAVAAPSRDFGSDSQLMAEKMFMGFGGVKPRLSRLNGAGGVGTGRVLGSESSYKARAMLMRGKDAARQLSGGHIVTFKSDAEEDDEAEAEWAAAEHDAATMLRSGRARMQETKRLEAIEKAAKRKIPGQTGADVKIRQWWDKVFGPIERAWEDERARRLAQ